MSFLEAPAAAATAAKIGSFLAYAHATSRSSLPTPFLSRRRSGVLACQRRQPFRSRSTLGVATARSSAESLP